MPRVPQAPHAPAASAAARPLPPAPRACDPRARALCASAPRACTPAHPAACRARPRPQHSLLRLVAIQPSLSSLQYTICIATQFQSNQPPQSRYKFCIVTLPSQSIACNTIFVLQHTSNSPCNTIPVAIQFCIATQPSLFL